MAYGSMTGNAAADLGLGGQLMDRVAGETEEERKRRIAQMKQAQLMGPAGGASAVTSLFGMRGASGVGY